MVRPGAAGLSGGLRAVDAYACDPESSGVVYVEATARVRAAVARHVGRRARAVGRPIVVAGGVAAGAPCEPWREILGRLGAGACMDAHGAAAVVRARAGGALLLVVEDRPTRWGRALVAELERAEPTSGAERLLTMILTDRAPAGTEAFVIQLAGGLSTGEARMWGEAVAEDPEEAMAPLQESLDALEAWWAVARATPAAARPAAGPEPEIDPEEALAEARSLEEAVPLDPWNLLRAAEIHAAASSFDRAEAAVARALHAVADATARSDFWARYEQMLARLPEEETEARLLRAADLALALGDGDHAFGFAQAALARSSMGDDTHAGMLALGRASSMRGDLTTATMALGKALPLAPDAASRARAAAELADVHYLAGDFAKARRLAEEAQAGGGDASTLLAASNVIGKLYLVSASWSEAEQHFAADTHRAARAGDLTAELRARVNRGIALLQWGRRDQARATLLAALDDGRRAGQATAVARSLYNLAVEAHLRHDHAEALRWYEEALDAARRQGERCPLAHVIRSLAELKLDLGLVAESEQTLAVGRRLCGPGMPGILSVHFDLLAAAIHLAQGRTAEAAGAVAAALTHVGCAELGQTGVNCHLLAARIALEDGDLGRAASALASAKALAPTGRREAEAAVVEASRARAAGAPFAQATLDALALARSAEASDLILEAHVLLAGTSEGGAAQARSHLAAAGALRDRLVAAVPPAIRPRFLSRRVPAALARLEAFPMGETPNPPPQALAGAASEDPPTHRPVVRAARFETPGPQGSPAARIVGNDPAIVALRESIPRLASADATLLIRGGSGTGKELVAEAVHAASRRRQGPLIKVNCAALVESLVLSELFGHEKDAFTGATGRKQGRFELAERGTIFLDEIGDISPRTQTALLRVLQERTYERVGGTATLRTDCRVICATHRDLRALVAQGAFREDLYFRLEGLVIDVPPLKRRLGDLAVIAEAILVRIAAESGQRPKRVSAGALSVLSRHGWPGNVRELENALRAASLFAEGEVLEAEDFVRHVEGLRALAEGGATEAAPRDVPQTLRTSELEPDPGEARDPEAPVSTIYDIIRGGVPLRDMNRILEKGCLARALTESRGNITRAAEILGMGRSRVSQLVSQHGFRSMEASTEEAGA